MYVRIIISSLIFVFAVMLVSPSVLFAQPASPANGQENAEKQKPRPNILDSLKRFQKKSDDANAKTELKQEAAQERQSARQSRLDARRKVRIEAYFTKMIRRLNAAVERLETLSLRIESRIQKFEEREVDVDTAKNLLLEATNKILVSKLAIGDALDSLPGFLDSGTPKDAFINVRELVRNTVTKIKDAHQALVQVIVELKGGGDNDEEEDE